MYNRLTKYLKILHYAHKKSHIQYTRLYTFIKNFTLYTQYTRSDKTFHYIHKFEGLETVVL